MASWTRTPAAPPVKSWVRDPLPGLTIANNDASLGITIAEWDSAQGITIAEMEAAIGGSWTQTPAGVPANSWTRDP